MSLPRILKIIAISLAVGAVIFFLWKTEIGDDEIYLVPEGYNGAIYVVLNQQYGEDAKYENGKRVYEIPSDGILKTKFNLNNGWHQLPQCFYVNNFGRMPIKYYQFGESVKGGDTIQACCLSLGGYNKNINDETVVFYVLFVGTEIEIDSAYEARMKMDLSKLFNL